MTIDSRYIPQVKKSDDDTVYTFEFETAGPEVVEVYLIDANGNRILVPNLSASRVELEP
jgi:hypothetical protein